MSSLRSVASDCCGESTPFAVKKDLFDYQLGPNRSLSVGNQLDRVRGQSFGLNLVLVCPDSFSAGEVREVEAAIQEARDLFATVGVGIREVEWYQVPSEEANGHCHIGGHGEAKALTQDWTVDNGLMDLFLVRDIAGKEGWSAIDGQCDKQSGGCEMSGSVLELFQPTAAMGILMAHELGHYFGLEHTSRTNNFMNSSVGPNNTNITTGQGQTIREKDCFTKGVC